MARTSPLQIPDITLQTQKRVILVTSHPWEWTELMISFSSLLIGAPRPQTHPETHHHMTIIVHGPCSRFNIWISKSNVQTRDCKYERSPPTLVARSPPPFFRQFIGPWARERSGGYQQSNKQDHGSERCKEVKQIKHC